MFDEAHFGIVESGSVVALAGRFRLYGLALGLGLYAAPFIWKNASSFPPHSKAGAADKIMDRTSLAGLVTLLERHIPPGGLAAVCWQELLKSNARAITAEQRDRAETVVRELADRPAGALREIQTIVAPITHALS